MRRDTRLARLYAEWELQPAKRCVAFANVIVESIREIIADFAAHNPLRYVVLVGGDDVIPFARIEDRAEISREWQWAGPYDSETPLGAALTYGYFLSDDPYGRSGPLDQRGKNVRTPTIAVGRLVESVDDIRAYLDWYARQGCLRGCVGAFLPWRGKRTATIKLESALVTGYTFVHDLGDEVKGALANAGTSVDDSLVNDVWTADQLANKIKDRNQLIAAQGHYSANTLVPAAAGTPKLVPTDPSIAKGDLAGRIWLTIGCHSGHNIVDRETRQAYRHPTSWPEALLRKGVTLVGGTGYQYAESVLLENSEKLYAYLTQELVGANEVAIGAALIAAKQRYLTQCLQVRGIDEKVLAVSILYGLPMLKVRPKTAVKPAQITPVVGTPATTSKSGIRTRQIELVSGLSDSDVKQLDGRDYFEASGQRVARPLRPVLPAVYRDITAGDHRPMGLLWTEGTYVESDHHPLIALPVLEERSAKRPRYRNRAFLPARPFRVARAGASQTLVFAPMQYRYERPDPPEGRRRLWQSAKATVYYSSRTDRSALLDAPALRDPRLAVVGGRLDATIAVRHYDSEAEDVRVFASYLDGSDLRTVALTAAAPSAADGIGFVRTFNGPVPAVPGVAPEQQRVFFQAVGANGRVSALMNGGRLFGVSRAATQATTLTLQAQATAGYRERIQVTAKLALAATGAPADGEVLFRLGGSRLWARTAGGVATVTLNVATRPRTGTSYRVTASFPGEGDLSGSSASRDVIVGKARTELIAESGITLIRGERTAVARLQLASDPARVLGLRPIVLRPGKDERVAYTDQDGVLRVEPSEVGESDEVELRFEGDDRYESASATVGIGRVRMRS
ncbi:MAG TPA: C25 family cysteine peptidase [Candidatus Limnocylindria bacterium]|nr:C25 family cysteine peptidase [Candidatus Limnocylindria bacterium]